MSKLKTFRPWTPGQTSLMPPSPIDWLLSDHLVFFLLELVEELEFALIMSTAQQRDEAVWVYWTGPIVNL